MEEIVQQDQSKLFSPDSQHDTRLKLLYQIRDAMGTSAAKEYADLLPWFRTFREAINPRFREFYVDALEEEVVSLEKRRKLIGDLIKIEEESKTRIADLLLRDELRRKNPTIFNNKQ